MEAKRRKISLKEHMGLKSQIALGQTFTILGDIVLLMWMISMLVNVILVNPFSFPEEGLRLWGWNLLICSGFLFGAFNFLVVRFGWLSTDTLRSTLSILKFYVFANTVVLIILLLRGALIVKVTEPLHFFWLEKWGGMWGSFLMSLVFVMKHRTQRFWILLLWMIISAILALAVFRDALFIYVLIGWGSSH